MVWWVLLSLLLTLLVLMVGTDSLEVYHADVVWGGPFEEAKTGLALFQ